MGKTEKEVLEAVGKPDSKSDIADGTRYWKYREISTDPVTEKLDELVQVVFEGAGQARALLSAERTALNFLQL